MVMEIIMIIIVALLDYLFTHKKWLINLRGKNELGDVIGGTNASIIGTFGVIFTFMVFYIQYQFNKL